MTANKTAPLLCVILLIGLGGCGSTPRTPAPAPSISISPQTVVAGAPDLTLTITGSNFVFVDSPDKVNYLIWSANGVNTTLATTFVSNSQLTAVVPAALLNSPVSARAHVEIWNKNGAAPDFTSNSVSFGVLIIQPGTPKISSISPTSVVAGSPDLSLTVTGEKFINENNYHSYTVWSVNGNGTFLSTAHVSDTQLTVVIPAALLISPVTGKISVQLWYKANDSPTSVSNTVDFNVNGP
jgi:hypothetical protein